MAISLGDNIKLGLGLPTDARYYNTSTNKPWTGVTEVNSELLGGIGGVRYTGLTVNIGGTEYWYKDGIDDGDLVEKTTGSGGGSSSLNWTGSTVNAIGTYMSADGICAQPNLTFDGTKLNVNGSALIGGTGTPARELEVTGTGNVYLKITAPTATDWSALELANINETWQIINDDTTSNTLKFRACATSLDALFINTGGTVTVNGIACATTCFAGSGAGLTGTAASLTAGAANSVAWANITSKPSATAAEINTVADGSTAKNLHVHGNINTGGCLGTAAGCIVCTTTSGCLATITPSSLTVGTATNALCLGGSAASTYVQNLSDLSITATASEINTVADGSTAKNSHTHDDRYYTESQSLGLFLRKDTNDTVSGRITICHPTTGEAALKVLRPVDDGSNTPALIVANDGEPTDVIAEFRGNASGIAVDTSDTPNSADAQFQICGTGVVCAKTCYIAPIMCATTCFKGSGAGLTGTASSLTVGTATNATTANNSTCLNGLTAGNYLRSNTTDYLTGTMYTRADIIAEDAYRDHGIYGTYCSAKTQHIWSMGTAYRNAADGSSFGDLYGLAYKYTSSGDKAGHAINVVQNGAETVVLGTNVWTSGYVKGTCFCGKAYDSDRLDNISSASFLRSDAADQKTSGNLRFNDNICATFGNSDDLDIYHDGTNSWIKNDNGNLYLCGTIYLRYAGVNRLWTISSGICVAGTGYATDWVASSDCRLKDCIQPLSNSLSIINELCGVKYNWCEDNSEDIGLIAQDVEKVAPVLVNHSEPTEEQAEKYCIADNDMLGLKYNKISALLIEAVKEQQLQIEELKSEIKILKDEKSL